MAGVSIDADKGGKLMAAVAGKREIVERNLIISGRKSPTVRPSQAALCLCEIQL